MLALVMVLYCLLTFVIVHTSSVCVLLFCGYLMCNYLAYSTWYSIFIDRRPKNVWTKISILCATSIFIISQGTKYTDNNGLWFGYLNEYHWLGLGIALGFLCHRAIHKEYKRTHG